MKIRLSQDVRDYITRVQLKHEMSCITHSIQTNLTN